MQEVWKIEGKVYFTDGSSVEGVFVKPTFFSQANWFGISDGDIPSFSDLISVSSGDLPKFSEIGCSTTFGRNSYSYSRNTAYDVVFICASGRAVPSSVHRILGLNPIHRPIYKSDIWHSVKKLRK
jgi:hypothetical protein